MGWWCSGPPSPGWGDGGFDFAQEVVTLYGQGAIGRLLDSRTGEVREGLLRSLRGRQ